MPDFHIPTDAEIAAEARRIILADLMVYDSIAALARKAGTNPFTLKKVFKKQYGISVFAFSRQQRMEQAKKFLQETNYTLQTIAELVGYPEGSNFQAAFKTVVGMTPGEWRRGGSI
jgi:AraC-like DNA-binding protein